jgi:hypothetical protein
MEVDDIYDNLDDVDEDDVTIPMTEDTYEMLR